MRKKLAGMCFLIVFSFIYLNAFAISALPSHLIALSSPIGTTLFNRSYSPAYFWPLSLQFVMQDNLAYCSIASSVMVLNALDVSAPNDPVYAPFKTFTQDNFFTSEVEKVLPSALVKKQGATLEQIGNALRTFSVSVAIVHADSITADQFRVLAKRVIEAKNGYIIVNFFRPALAEEGAGHMSPLAAYDKHTDRFLMLDVARYRYPSVWVKTKDLWSAMHTVDKEAKAYRGLFIIKKLKEHLS